MRKGMNVLTHGELLGYAESIGYDWNEALDLLTEDGVLPNGESAQSTFFLRDYIKPHSSLNSDTVKILAGFMTSEKIDSFLLIQDN